MSDQNKENIWFRSVVMTATIFSSMAIALFVIYFWYSGEIKSSNIRVSKIAADYENIEAVKRDIYRLEDQISLIKSSIQSRENNTEIFGDIVVQGNKWSGEQYRSQLASGNGEPISCPDGQYVTSIQLIDRDAGRYCTACITNIVMFCNDL